MPSTYLIDDKPRVCSRYVYQACEGADEDDLSQTAAIAKRRRRLPWERKGSGDSYHSIYAGLNYYLCGNSSKVQVGVEYETMDQEDGDDADATTLWAAYRMYF